jgi:Rrf2 family protein
MKLSTKATYGLRAMLYLSAAVNNDPISLHTIAKEAQLPEAYLERLFSQLKKSGLVVAAKGVAGGYCLAESSSKLTVWQVINTLEPKKGIFLCSQQSQGKGCSASCKCQADGSLLYIEKQLRSTLNNIYLQDLIKHQ